MIRLFAALSLPDRVCARLEGVQKGLPGRRVPPENFHVTLRFFGVLPEPQAEDLHDALEAIRAPGFEIWLDGAGAFGGDKPRSLHALVRPASALTHLAAKVDQASRGAGVAVEARKFVPHVTLARFSKGEIGAAETARLLDARQALLEGPVSVRSFTLFRSELGKAAPLYTPLADYALIEA